MDSAETVETVVVDSVAVGSVSREDDGVILSALSAHGLGTDVGASLASGVGVECNFCFSFLFSFLSLP